MFPDVQQEQLVFQGVPIASGPVCGHHLKHPVSFVFTASLQVFIYIDKFPLNFHTVPFLLTFNKVFFSIGVPDFRSQSVPKS